MFYLHLHLADAVIQSDYVHLIYTAEHGRVKSLAHSELKSKALTRATNTELSLTTKTTPIIKGLKHVQKKKISLFVFYSIGFSSGA